MRTSQKRKKKSASPEDIQRNYRMTRKMTDVIKNNLNDVKMSK